MFRFEWFVARRYLFGAQGGAEGRRFLRFVMLAAIGGVAVGVASLLLSLSIVRGFSAEIRNKIVGFGAHVQVESLQDEPLGGAAALGRQLAAVGGVRHVAPVVQDFVLLRRSARDIEGVVLWGADRLPPYLGRNLLAGLPTLAPGAAPRVIVGAALARQLSLKVGDRVTTFSMRGLGPERPLAGAVRSGRPRVTQFVVGGIYETFLENFDDVYVFTDLASARKVLGYTADQVTRFDLTLAALEEAGPVAEQIGERFGFPVMARTIFEVWHGLFAWIDLQENIIPLVISVIILVAAFNIVGALLMIVLEKTREIGVMQSLGARRKALRRLFVLLGLAVGAVGTALGELLALGLALVQQRFKVIPLPSEAYYMDSAPIVLNPMDFLLVAVIALALCLVAAYLPARVAAGTDPIRVIRFS